MTRHVLSVSIIHSPRSPLQLRRFAPFQSQRFRGGRSVVLLSAVLSFRQLSSLRRIHGRRDFSAAFNRWVGDNGTIQGQLTPRERAALMVAIERELSAYEG